MTSPVLNMKTARTLSEKYEILMFKINIVPNICQKIGCQHYYDTGSGRKCTKTNDPRFGLSFMEIPKGCINEDEMKELITTEILKL